MNRVEHGTVQFDTALWLTSTALATITGRFFQANLGQPVPPWVIIIHLF